MTDCSGLRPPRLGGGRESAGRNGMPEEDTE